MAPEVRISGPENEPMGVVSLSEALRLAGEMDVDLVEIAPMANPPSPLSPSVTPCRSVQFAPITTPG